MVARSRSTGQWTRRKYFSTQYHYCVVHSTFCIPLLSMFHLISLSAWQSIVLWNAINMYCLLGISVVAMMKFLPLQFLMNSNVKESSRFLDQWSHLYWSWFSTFISSRKLSAIKQVYYKLSIRPCLWIIIMLIFRVNDAIKRSWLLNYKCIQGGCYKTFHFVLKYIKLFSSGFTKVLLSLMTLLKENTRWDGYNSCFICLEVFLGSSIASCTFFQMYNVLICQ